MKFVLSLFLTFFAKAQQETAEQVVQRVCAGKAPVVTVETRDFVRSDREFPFRNRQHAQACRQLSNTALLKQVRVTPEGLLDRLDNSYVTYDVGHLDQKIAIRANSNYYAYSLDITTLNSTHVRKTFEAVPNNQRVALVTDFEQWLKLADVINGNASKVLYVVIGLDPDRDYQPELAAILNSKPRVPLSVMYKKPNADAKKLAMDLQRRFTLLRVLYTVKREEDHFDYFKTYEV